MTDLPLEIKFPPVSLINEDGVTVRVKTFSIDHDEELRNDLSDSIGADCWLLSIVDRNTGKQIRDYWNTRKFYKDNVAPWDREKKHICFNPDHKHDDSCVYHSGSPKRDQLIEDNQELLLHMVRDGNIIWVGYGYNNFREDYYYYEWKLNSIIRATTMSSRVSKHL